jgi:hypothetical protein
MPKRRRSGDDARRYRSASSTVIIGRNPKRRLCGQQTSMACPAVNGARKGGCGTMLDGRLDGSLVSSGMACGGIPWLTGRVQYLRDLMAFFGVRFKIQPQKSVDEAVSATGEVVVSCVGVGFSNVNKSMA